MRPLLTPHVDHAKIGVSARYLRIKRQDTAKVTLRVIQIILLECNFPLLKKPLGIAIRRRCRSFLCCLSFCAVWREACDAGNGHCEHNDQSATCA